MKRQRSINKTTMSGTKLEIFKAALDLFAQRGYSCVGIRDIAEVVKIKSASLYNHFASKDAILESAYDFFHDNFFENQPEPREILKLIPTTPPREVLDMLSQPFFCQDTDDLTRKILIIALKERNNDQRAAYIISKLQTTAEQRVSSSLKRMQELGLIEPLDTDAFAAIFVSFSISVATSEGQNEALSSTRWESGRDLLLGTIKYIS